MRLTDGQLRALRIAAFGIQPSERIEIHPHGKQYIAELTAMGLIKLYPSARGIRYDVTPLAAEVLHRYWTGELTAQPADH